MNLTMSDLSLRVSLTLLFMMRSRYRFRNRVSGSFNPYIRRQHVQARSQKLEFGREDGQLTPFRLSDMASDTYDITPVDVAMNGLEATFLVVLSATHKLDLTSTVFQFIEAQTCAYDSDALDPPSCPNFQRLVPFSSLHLPISTDDLLNSGRDMPLVRIHFLKVLQCGAALIGVRSIITFFCVAWGLFLRRIFVNALELTRLADIRFSS